jgi:hypothetical protein
MILYESETLPVLVDGVVCNNLGRFAGGPAGGPDVAGNAGIPLAALALPCR